MEGAEFGNRITASFLSSTNPTVTLSNSSYLTSHPRKKGKTYFPDKSDQDFFENGENRKKGLHLKAAMALIIKAAPLFGMPFLQDFLLTMT